MIAYLRRLLPLALGMMLVLSVTPFIVDSDRINLLLSGSVPAWRWATVAMFIVLGSFAVSAIADWEDRRKCRKSRRR